MSDALYTIGHSTHTVEQFIQLLKKHSVTAVCDVRSRPYSQYNPQFNREVLTRALEENNISYVFLGKELGARSENPDCYINGKVQYKYLANETIFRQGIDRLIQGMRQYTVALMCAEKDPLTCHRTILVCREIRSTVGEIKHILCSGEIETNYEAEKRLLTELRFEPDMFMSETECIEEAYDKQGKRIAYVEKGNDTVTG